MRFRVCAQQQHGPRPPLVYSCSVLAHVPARRFSSNLFFVSLVFLTSCTHSTLSTPSAPIGKRRSSRPTHQLPPHSCTCLRAALHYYVPPDLRVLDKQWLTLSLLSRISEAYSSKNHNPVISSSIHLDRSLDSHQVHTSRTNNSYQTWQLRPSHFSPFLPRRRRHLRKPILALAPFIAKHHKHRLLPVPILIHRPTR